MRELSIGSHRFTKVIVLDEPGQGNACHEYIVNNIDHGNERLAESYADVKFQDGPIKENRVNGCHQEDLLAIVIDRLESFQAGEFACEENHKALGCIKEALKWLNHRTAVRQKRGVEGTNIK